MRKFNLPLTYEPKIQPVIDGTIRQTIRTGTKFSVGDLIRFYTWQGKPYRSKRTTITEYLPIKKILPLKLFPNGFYYDIPEDRTIAWRSSIYGQALAELDGIVPPTGVHKGVALYYILTEKNGQIPTEGIEAQAMRW
jgi:hypothetical protein